jgi:hypothetical protein
LITTVVTYRFLGTQAPLNNGFERVHEIALFDSPIEDGASLVVYYYNENGEVFRRITDIRSIRAVLSSLYADEGLSECCAVTVYRGREIDCHSFVLAWDTLWHPNEVDIFRPSDRIAVHKRTPESRSREPVFDPVRRCISDGWVGKSLDNAKGRGNATTITR